MDLKENFKYQLGVCVDFLATVILFVMVIFPLMLLIFAASKFDIMAMARASLPGVLGSLILYYGYPFAVRKLGRENFYLIRIYDFVSSHINIKNGGL